MDRGTVGGAVIDVIRGGARPSAGDGCDFDGLIGERGFACVAVGSDWPDAYRVYKFIRAVGGGPGPV